MPSCAPEGIQVRTLDTASTAASLAQHHLEHKASRATEERDHKDAYDANLLRQCTNSHAAASARENAEQIIIPSFQSSLDVVGCSQVMSNCSSSAAEAHEVQHAISLCGSDLAFLTIKKFGTLKVSLGSCLQGGTLSMSPTIAKGNQSNAKLVLESLFQRICPSVASLP